MFSRATAWLFAVMSEIPEPRLLPVWPKRRVPDFHLFPILPVESRTHLLCCTENRTQERWTVGCMAFGSGWQIHYCFVHSSKQSRSALESEAVTAPAPWQHHTININKRQKARCPQGGWIRNVTSEFWESGADLQCSSKFTPAQNILSWSLEGANS